MFCVWVFLQLFGETSTDTNAIGGKLSSEISYRSPGNALKCTENPWKGQTRRLCQWKFPQKAARRPKKSNLVASKTRPSKTRIKQLLSTKTQKCPQNMFRRRSQCQWLAVGRKQVPEQLLATADSISAFCWLLFGCLSQR